MFQTTNQRIIDDGGISQLATAMMAPDVKKGTQNGYLR